MYKKKGASNVEAAAAAAASRTAPASGLAGLYDKNPFHMASQPYSTGEAVVQVVRHQRTLTEDENRQLSAVPAGQRQIILMMNVPLENMERGMGIDTFLSRHDAEISFQRIRKLAESGGFHTTDECKRLISGEVMRSLLRLMAAINTIHSGCIEEMVGSEGVYSEGLAVMQKAHAMFVEEVTPWQDCFSDLNGPNPLFIESVFNSEGTAVQAARLVNPFRTSVDEDPQEAALDVMERLLVFVTRRYEEDRSQALNVGHIPSENAGGGRNGGRGEDPRQQTLEDFGLGNQGGGGGGGDGEDAETAEYYRKNGIDWSRTPLSRRRNAGSMLKNWEYSIMRLLEIRWSRLGLGAADVEKLLAYFWEGDVFSYRHREANEATGRSSVPHIDHDARRRIRQARSFERTGLVTREFCRKDWRRLGNYNENSRRLGAIQPAHLFTPLNFCSWLNGDVDTTQAYIGNYFSVNQRAERPALSGHPTQDLHALFREKVVECDIVRTGLLKYPASHNMVSALLMGPEAVNPETLGARFRGFPYPERVTVLSPMSSTPWRLPTVILPHPPDKKSTAQNAEEALKENDLATVPKLYNMLRRAAKYLIPSTDAELNLLGSRAARTLLYGPRAEVEALTRKPFDADLGIIGMSVEDIGGLLTARVVAQYLMVTTCGMLKDWRALPDHARIWSPGGVTMTQFTVQGDVKASDPDDANTLPGLLATEPDWISSDHVTYEKWETFLGQVDACLAVRDLHLRLDYSNETFPIELSHFTRVIETQGEVMPWLTKHRSVRSMTKEARMAVNEGIYQTVYAAHGDPMGGDSSDNFNRTWSYRMEGPQARASVPQMAPPTSTNDDCTLLHNGWKMIGELRYRGSDGVDKMRAKTDWFDFLGFFTREHAKFTDLLMKHYTLYCIAAGTWRNKHETNPAVDAVAVIQTACVDTIMFFYDFSAALAQANLRPLLAYVTPNPAGWKKWMPHVNDVHAAILTEWISTLGKVGATKRIPLEKTVGRWRNLETAHACMMAHLTLTFRELGVGFCGTSHMISFAHLLFATNRTSLVMSRERSTLQAVNLLFSGGSSSGKSTTVNMALSLLVRGTYKEAVSMSSRALQVPKNFDGLILYMDEGLAALFQTAPGKDDDQKNIWKAMLTQGYDIRGVCNIDQDTRERDLEDIISSHRRQFIFSNNDATHRLPEAIHGRFLEVLVKSVASSEKQPLYSTFQARAGQTAVRSELYASADKAELTAFWRMHHAAKGVLEMLAQASLITIHTATAHDQAIALLAPMKAHIEYNGIMSRVHQNLGLLLRSAVTDLAAYMILCDWANHRDVNGFSLSEECIPFSFICARAPHYTFATTSMAVHCISMMFRDMVDHEAHVHIVAALLADRNRLEKIAPDLVPALTVPISREAISAIGGGDNGPHVVRIEDDGFGDSNGTVGIERPVHQYCVWSDDPGVKHPVPAAVDFNYVAFPLGCTSQRAYTTSLHTRMPETAKYAPEQLRSAIAMMSRRTFLLTPQNDANRKYADMYDAELAKMAARGVGAMQQQRLQQQQQQQQQQPGANTGLGDYAFSPKSAALLQAMNEGMQNDNGNISGYGQQQRVPLMQQAAQAQAAAAAMPRGANNVLDPNGTAAPGKKPGLPVTTSMKNAAFLGMPLQRYKKDERLPIIKFIGVTNSKKKENEFMLAVSRQYLDQVIETLGAQEGNETPSTSTLIQILAKNLGELSPLPAYPEMIYEMNGGNGCVAMKSETMMTSLAMDTDDKYVFRRLSHEVRQPRIFGGEERTVDLANDAMDVEIDGLAISGTRPPPNSNNHHVHPEIRRLISNLPGRVAGDGVVLTAYCPIRVEFTPGIMVRLTNDSARSSLDRSRDPLYEMLNDVDVPQIRDYCSDASLMKRASDQGDYAQIYTALFAERYRLKCEMGMDNRILKHSVDWESYICQCAEQTVPLMPLDPANLRALPHIYYLAYRNRFHEMTGAPRSNDVFPLVELEHHLKTAVHTVVHRELPRPDLHQRSLRINHPSRHKMTGFGDWLRQLAVDLNGEAVKTFPQAPRFPVPASNTNVLSTTSALGRLAIDADFD